jgi:SOS-response transcriptional repressor LexA
METITAAQEQVLRFIVRCQREGFTPSMSAISNQFGWKSANSAQEHVDRLIKKAFLIRPAYKRLVVTEYALRCLEE